MSNHDVVVKHSQPVRIAEAVATADGYGSENLGPVFAAVLPRVASDLGASRVEPGICVAHYDEYVEGTPYVVHVGFDIGEQDFAGTDTVHVVVLPPVRVASIIHHGPVDDIVATYGALARWIDDSGNHMSGPSRELYHEWHEDDPSRNITEIQLLLDEEPRLLTEEG